MSKTITIQEAGVPKSATVSEIKTNGINTTVLWVPEDETEKNDLTATENKTYTPEEGYYAIGIVTVNVPDTGAEIVAKSNRDGCRYKVTVDNRGILDYELLPSKLQVVTMPTKTTYDAGEQIDYTGMVVRLMDGKDEVFTDEQHPNGTIPLLELTLVRKPLPEVDVEVPIRWLSDYDGSILYTTIRIHVNGSE